MTLYYLSDTWPWFGEHQCYNRMVHYVQKVQPQTKVVMVKYDLLNKMLGKIYNLGTGHSWRRDNVFAAAEFKFSRYLKNNPEKDDIYHILFFDNHYLLMSRREKAPRTVVGTIHHPIGREYPRLMEEHLKKLSSAIVMFSEGVEYFEKYIGRGRVKFIPYGVDTEFFYPANPMPHAPRPMRLLYTGQNGRNPAMLKRVIRKLSERHKDLVFDLLVPESARKGELRDLHQCPAVRWHNNVPEERLRRMYQDSYLLLMPMQSSGVNTAIVEATACGLPVVTTDVGGVRDYGGGSVYPVVANDDDDAMVDLVGRYLTNESWRNEIARECRKFAEEKLAWPLVASKHIEAYRELLLA